MEKQVSFLSNGKRIYGMWHYPAGRKNYLALVMCHGFSATKIGGHQLFVKFSRDLVKSGIASLRFDCMGSGESEGLFQDMTINSEVRDTLAAVKFVKSQEGVKKIALLGMSMGGYVVFVAANKSPDICTTILMCAVYEMGKLLEELERFKFISKGIIDREGDLIGMKFFTETKKLPDVTEYKKTINPVLLIHGDRDTSVPLAHPRKYCRYFKKQNIKHELKIIKGADHIFSSHKFETEVFSATKKWLKKFD